MKLKRKIGAKINLTLDVVGERGGFHLLKSLVSEISLADGVCVKKRKDDKITLKVKGANLPTGEDNNAYKAAKLFREKFHTSGVDITIKKNIPLGGGLGGSSADVAGVLILMKELFAIDEDLKEISSLLGSDVYFMIYGKSAILQGKGEELTQVKGEKKLYLLLATAKNSCLAKDCYKEYDAQGKTYPECTDSAVRFYERGDIPSLISVMKNDLTPSAIRLTPEIEHNLKKLSVCGNSFMSGSGSVTFSLFESKKERDFWYRKLKKDLSLIKAETII